MADYRKRRVGITGLGVVSPIGVGADEFQHNLLAGRSGISFLDEKKMDAGARVRSLATEELHHFRVVSYAIAATKEALSMSGRHNKVYDCSEVGIAVSAGQSVLLGKERTLCSCSTSIPPTHLCSHIIAHRFGFGARIVAPYSACASGNDAIGYAYRMVSSGRLDWMIAGGTDASVNPILIGAFKAMGVMAKKNVVPGAMCRPFDSERSGLVLGEGSGIVIVESMTNARTRGAAVLAEIIGYGSAINRDSLFGSDLAGKYIYVSMKRAIDDAGIASTDVDCVNAHGTGTIHNDIGEARAIQDLFGPYRPLVYATKAQTGHAVAASGAWEAIISTMSLRSDVLPPNINLANQDARCPIRCVGQTATPYKHDIVLNNSIAFGGQTSTLVLLKGDPR